jgi:hypothetical protein
VATPDPYHEWSGAPKHWVHVPTQRCCSPSPDQLDAAAEHPCAEDGSASRGEWTVAAIALAVAVAAFVVIGAGGAETEENAPPPLRTSGTSVR